MTDDRTALEDLAALDAAGALDAVEQRQLHEQLGRASAAERARIAQLYEHAAHLAISVTAGESLEPSPDVRARLTNRVAASRLYTVHAQDGWLTAPLPGIMLKVLSRDLERNTVTLLMRAAPGARYPAHHHTGGEDCYVISGEVVIEGRTLRAGDFHRAEKDTDHEVQFTDIGAEVLLVVNAADYW